MGLWIAVNVLLNLLTIINTTFTILLCLLILVLVIHFYRQSRSVPLLLAGHSCCLLFLSAFMLTSMATASLFGYMNIDLEQHGSTQWCFWRGFLIHGFLCALYDSYTLQAIYRLCRVVFYRCKYLHSFPLYALFVPIDSVFGIVSILPVLLRGDVVYLQSEYYCQTPFSNIPAINYIAVRLFILPISLIALIYIYLLKRVRQSNSSSRVMNYSRYRRAKQNKRDLIVIRRLLLMLCTLVLLGLPSVVFLSIFMITGYLVPITYRIGWLSVSFSLVFLAYMLIRSTDPLKKTIRQHFQRNSSQPSRHLPSLE